MSNISARSSEAMLHAAEHWRARREAQLSATAPKRKFSSVTIAVSREAGAGGTALARELGKRLNWPVYDHELVERIGREMGLRTELLKSVDERNMSWLLECLEAFASNAPVSESAYVQHLMETVLALGSHGECIIVGRGAPHFLPASSTLRIRVVADLEDRVRQICRELRLSTDEAAQHIRKTDQERKRFVQDHFQKDLTDPVRYDLILNTSRFTMAEAADIVLVALKQLQARAESAAG